MTTIYRMGLVACAIFSIAMPAFVADAQKPEAEITGRMTGSFPHYGKATIEVAGQTVKFRAGANEIPISDPVFGHGTVSFSTSQILVEISADGGLHARVHDRTTKKRYNLRPKDMNVPLTRH